MSSAQPGLRRALADSPRRDTFRRSAERRKAMTSGAHMIIYSADADADRAFFRDVLKFPSIDAGQGWLIFALPPSEVAVHPMAESGSRHELYLMCDDVEATIGELTSRRIECGPV